MLIDPSSSGLKIPPDSVPSPVDVLRTTPDRAAELVGPNFPSELQTLTDAEWRVICHLKLGMSNKEIASAVERSEATVKNQVASVLHKLCVPTRARLIALLWCAEVRFAHESRSAGAPQPTSRVSGHSTHQCQPPKMTAHWRGVGLVATS